MGSTSVERSRKYSRDRSHRRSEAIHHSAKESDANVHSDDRHRSSDRKHHELRKSSTHHSSRSNSTVDKHRKNQDYSYDDTKYGSKNGSRRSRGSSRGYREERSSIHKSERRGGSYARRSHYRSESLSSDSKHKKTRSRSRSRNHISKSSQKAVESNEYKSPAEKKKSSSPPVVTKKSRSTGWDSGPSPIPPLLPSLSTLPFGNVGFSTSLAARTGKIQEELAERQAQAASIAATMQMRASTSQLCRIYVGSLDYSLTENDIRQVFSAFGPITNVDMPKEGNRSKGFCFVEYATPESANMAITTMPGFNLKGRAIKVGRPTALGGQSSNALTSVSMLLGGGLAPKAAGVNAAEAGQIAAAMLLAKVDQTSLSQSDSQCRIYVGSIPYSFTCDDIKQIFDVFGRILSCQLIPSNERPGTHRGYGFIEYSTVDEARLAIETMNDFAVAGKVLKVNYATALRGTPGLMGIGFNTTPPLSLPATGANAVPVISQLPASTLPTTATPTFPQTIQENKPAAVESLETSSPQEKVIMLYNMVTKTEANDDLKEEIQQECSKYGVVSQVQVVPHETTDDVRIFVEFKLPQHAALAIPSLHDRWFGGRRIIAKFYDSAAFAAQKYWL